MRRVTEGRFSFGTNSLYVYNLDYYQLWFEYLAMSPSYELARLFRAGKLTEKELASKLRDWKRVVEVYDDLGDVQRMQFSTWSRERVSSHIGYHGKPPSVQEVVSVDRLRDPKPSVRIAVDKFIDGPWREQGRQQTIIAAIPVGMPYSRIASQIKALWEERSTDEQPLKLRAPKYDFVARKLTPWHALLGYLQVLWIRCEWPDDPLWKIGVRAQVSSMHSHWLDANSKDDRKDSDQDTQRKYTLKILTCRALRRGRMIAENAARGTFPDHKKYVSLVEFDFKELNKIRIKRLAWQQRHFC